MNKTSAQDRLRYAKQPSPLKDLRLNAQAGKGEAVDIVEILSKVNSQ
jgi:hypothetical protein